MARPERRDVDYFPFIVKRGRTLNILQNKFGLEGIGFFTNLMRLLAQTPDHYYCISDECDRMNFFAEIGIEENKGIAMIELMVKTQKLDKILWENHKVIVCPVFLLSVKDAYKERKNEIITIEEIRSKYCVTEFPPEIHSENTGNDGFTPHSAEFPPKIQGDNTQSKVKKSKVKKSKVDSTGKPGKEPDIPKPKKPSLKDREPENDYERVEKAYLQDWLILYNKGRFKNPEPIVNWNQTRALLKNLFLKMDAGQIIQAINNGMRDDFVLQSGYSLPVMLSATVLNRLLNSGVDPTLSTHQQHKITL